MATISNDTINLDDAEEFSLPTSGGHYAFVGHVELGRNNKDTHDMFTINHVLAPDDKDAPNFPMRYWLMWPNPDDKEVMWGTRTAYGSMIKKVKEYLTAVGGPESGNINKDKVAAILGKSEGKKIKLNIRQTILKEEELEKRGLSKDDPRALQVNIESVEPA